MRGSSHVKFHWSNRSVRPQFRPLSEPGRRGRPWWTLPALTGVACALVAIGAALYVWGSSGAVLVANAGPRPATTATADKPALPAVAPAQPTLSAGPATPTPQATFDDEILRRRAAAEEPAPIGNWPIVAISTPQETIAPATTPTVVAESDAAYVVRAGDTFVGIAAYLGVDDGQLARLNNVIDRDRLTIGQKLKVPTRFTAQSTTVPARPPADSAAAIRPRFIWPAIGVVTTEFGEVGSVWIGGVHTGLDVAAPPGDPVLASESGKVLDAAWSTSRGYGNYVMIDHGVGYRTLYGHLSVIRVKEGQEVKRGQLIGDIGSTGVSSGPHLHFEIHDMGKPVDPIPFIGQKPPADRLKLPRSITAF